MPSPPPTPPPLPPPLPPAEQPSKTTDVSKVAPPPAKTPPPMLAEPAASLHARTQGDAAAQLDRPTGARHVPKQRGQQARRTGEPGPADVLAACRAQSPGGGARSTPETL